MAGLTVFETDLGTQQGRLPRSPGYVFELGHAEAPSGVTLGDGDSNSLQQALTLGEVGSLLVRATVRVKAPHRARTLPLEVLWTLEALLSFYDGADALVEERIFYSRVLSPLGTVQTFSDIAVGVRPLIAEETRTSVLTLRLRATSGET